ncbi:MAG TPA: cation transporter [Actinomycetota bacterium]|nr:cation transporter [Actinomycetota bacterium]
MERLRLQRLAIRLEYGTIVWNLGEAVLTIAFGIAAGSLALVAFGTDSIIEVFASGVVVWHEREEGPAEAARSSRALRLVAAAFVALAIVLGSVAARDIITGRRADGSVAGIVYLTMAACVMFGLAIWKRRVATRLGSAPLRSEAALTFLDGILSVMTLTGLALNAVFGLWWADPAAALIVALAAANEGRESLREARMIAGEGERVRS